MARYLFDIHKTLVSNPAATTDQTLGLVRLLVQQGHEVVIMTGDLWDLPDKVANLGLRIMEKPINFHRFKGETTAVDDCPHILRCAARAGMKTVHASELGDWFQKLSEEATRQPIQKEASNG